jgi:mutator protein MutT
METHPLQIFQFCPVCGSAKWVINNFKSKHCLECGFVFYGNPSAAVACILLQNNKDLLVCRRAKDPAKGMLDLPGGFVDFGETAEEALRRELKEELNIEILDPQLFTTIPNIYTYSGMQLNTLDLIYIAQIEDSSQLCAADDVSEAFFVPLNTISPEEFGLDSIKKGIIALLKEYHQ